MPQPRSTPATPPVMVRTMDSTRNWIMMSAFRAPRALRNPISRVRSVTDTSIMFMMPIPPTSSEMAATAPRSMLIVLVALPMASWISVISWNPILSRAVSSRWLRLTMRSLISSFAVSMRSADCTSTSMCPTYFLPISRYIAVVTGIRTTSSSSRHLLPPLGGRTPITLNGMRLIFSVFPTGLAPSKSSRTTVLPRTATFSRERISRAMKNRPVSGSALRMSA